MLRSKAGIAVSHQWSSHRYGLAICTSAHLGSMSVKPIRLIDLFRYYQKLGHQTAAIEELEQQILKAAPDIFNRDQ